MYSSIDRLADTLEGQVRKTKEKVRRRKAGSGKDFSGSTEPLEDELDDDSELRIVMTEQVFAKPMDIDEAALQLKHSSGEFMVFTNRHTMRINVLYRRKDGQLGLIDTVA
jgi:putative sigma-54 modulation protein